MTLCRSGSAASGCRSGPDRAGCRRRAGRHRRRMRHPGWNAIDRRRGPLRPRDYCCDPFQFGEVEDANFHLPDGGRVVDLYVARLQHQLVVRWRAGGRLPSSGRFDARWGISKAVLSRTARGERWAGETVLAALATAVGSDPDRRCWT